MGGERGGLETYSKLVEPRAGHVLQQEKTTSLEGPVVGGGFGFKTCLEREELCGIPRGHGRCLIF